jgi:hypothetical protein
MPLQFSSSLVIAIFYVHELVGTTIRYTMAYSRSVGTSMPLAAWCIRCRPVSPVLLIPLPWAPLHLIVLSKLKNPSPRLVPLLAEKTATAGYGSMTSTLRCCNGGYGWRIEWVLARGNCRRARGVQVPPFLSLFSRIPLLPSPCFCGLPWRLRVLPRWVIATLGEGRRPAPARWASRARHVTPSRRRRITVDVSHKSSERVQGTSGRNLLFWSIYLFLNVWMNITLSGEALMCWLQTLARGPHDIHYNEN